MEYQIITAGSTEELELRVNQWIEAGWEPQGGCAYHSRVRIERQSGLLNYLKGSWSYMEEKEFVWSQAMIRRTK